MKKYPYLAFVVLGAALLRAQSRGQPIDTREVEVRAACFGF